LLLFCKKEESFFSEEKKQKTFANWRWQRWALVLEGADRLPGRRVAGAWWLMLDSVSDHVVEGHHGPTYPLAYDAAPGAELTDIEAFRHGHPFATYARLRAKAPVCWTPEPDERPGFWAVTRYAEVAAVNSDAATFSSQRGSMLMALGRPEARHRLLFPASMNTMINLDGASHMQLRREHMPYFTPRYLDALKDRVAQETTRLLDAMQGAAAGGEVDMVANFSSRLPLFTLCEILGVPEADRPKVLHWMHYLELAEKVATDQAKSGGAPTLELMQFVMEFNENVEEMFQYGQHMLKLRRQDPKEDLMSAIARAQVGGELLSDEFLDGSWLLIIFAGNDTTRNTLSGTARLLTEFPAQRARLAANPDLLGNAANEFIRMVSPVMYMRRTATRDTVLAGQQIAADEKVIMYYGAANRDPEVFTDPDTLDVARPNADKHLAFGYGPHVCLGKRVAQIQLEEAYRQILARFPQLEWTGDIDIAPNNFVHAIRRLPVRLRA
jgi:cytochrome P450